MKLAFYIIPVLTVLPEACGQNSSALQQQKERFLTGIIRDSATAYSLINPKGNTIETRFIPPSRFKRMAINDDSFAQYLRQLPLKPHNSTVRLYDGNIKYDCGVYDAVVALGIGNKDLHQCADAIMRLKAEYLWNQRQYDKIHFNLTNGFRADYSEWIKGKRIAINGNTARWIQTNHSVSDSYQNFWDYMEFIFSYAGTYSLSKELIAADINDIQAGDIFIEGGFPGHAVIVVDVAINEKNNRKVFLLAQSFMPAQEIQILKNPNDSTLTPWYSTDFVKFLYTPEWTFEKSALKRFKD